MSEIALTTFVTLFVVIDPVGIAPLFVGLTPGQPNAARRRIARHAVVIAAGVLIAFALGGQWLLNAMGIGLPAFRIAGGILLLLLAIDMVMARPSGLRTMTPREGEESSHAADVTVFPLAIPLIAGPGAMTSIVLMMGEAGGALEAQALVLGLTLVVLALTLACLWAASRLMRLLGTIGVNVITRVFGIVTAALAVQFVVDGVQSLVT